MALHIRVISQHPAGGRFTLYAGYAEVLASCPDIRVEGVFSTERDAHGSGFPSLLVNGVAVQPADRVLLMPTDLCAVLAAAGLTEVTLAALEAPLERMLEGSA